MAKPPPATPPNMKRIAIAPKLSAKQVQALIDAAPEHADDRERAYDPNDEKAVEAYWKNAVFMQGGGYEAVRAALAARRTQREVSKPTARRAVLMPSSEENAKVVAAAKTDPDAPPLSQRQLAAMVPLKSVRGRPTRRGRKAGGTT